EVRTALLDLLTDPGRYVRIAAVEALGGAVQESEVRRVLLGLLADRDEYVRQAVVEELRGALAEPDVRMVLLDTLDSLGMGSRELTPVLVDVVEEPEVQRA